MDSPQITTQETCVIPYPDFIKMTADHTRHITTLAAGAIVVVVTFYDKFNSQHSWKWLMYFSLICFVLSILVGIASSIVTISDDVIEEGHRIIGAVMFAVCHLFFGAAMIALCLYGLINI